jgi:hypothetical protein
MPITSYTLPPLGGWTGVAGIPGGIPSTYTMYCNVRSGIPNYTGFAASGDGINDDAPAINGALSGCPSGQYVYIPAGTYRLNNIIGRQNNVSYDDLWKQVPLSIAIKGDGPALTRLLSYVPPGTDSLSFLAGASPQESYAISGGDFRGSTGIYITGFVDVAGGNNHPNVITTGKWMIVVRPNTGAGFVPIPGNGYMDNSCSQYVRVVSISGGATGPYLINFTPPLNEGAFGTTLTSYINFPYRCGLEGFYIKRAQAGNGNTINLQGAQECWITGVETDMAQNWHIRLEACAGCEIRNNYVHSGWGNTSNQDYGVGLYKYSCNNLIENNVFSDTRHAMLTEYGGQLNVFAYNYSRYPSDGSVYLMGDLIHHGGNPRWNLWEGNVASDIKWDVVLGPMNYSTALRNYLLRSSLPEVYVACYGTDIQSGSYSGNLLGNVYAQAPVGFVSGDNRLRRWGSVGDVEDQDPLVQGTTYMDAEFPIYSGVTWNTGNPNHLLLQSYYLSGRPSWWTPNAPWPAIGVDLAYPNMGNPAYWRVNGYPIKQTRLGGHVKFKGASTIF